MIRPIADADRSRIGKNLHGGCPVAATRYDNKFPGSVRGYEEQARFRR
jgi:hypothetical protein